MMNKGLELIEAARLFGLPEDRIEVLVHPQSIVHGMVYYQRRHRCWRSSARPTCASRSPTRWPGRSAWRPPRPGSTSPPSAGSISSEPDPVRFPALRLARDALRAGGGAPTILNAANEVAVAAFLQRRLGFLDIVAW